MRHLLRCAEIGVLAVALSGCGGGGGNGGGIQPPPGDGTGEIGPSGGSVSLAGGPTVTIPAGALGAVTSITVRKAAGPAPLGALGDVYEFGPEGTPFASAVTVGFPVPQGTTATTVYWTKAGSATDYEALPTTVSGTAATAAATHFSGGFVALPSIRAIASCTARGAARMYALVAGMDAILADVANVASLPDWIRQPYPVERPDVFEFDLLGERVLTTMWSAADLGHGWPINSVVIFQWTLTAGDEVTGSGQFSFIRMNSTTLQVVPSGPLEPTFFPDASCSVVVDTLGVMATITSDPLYVKASGAFSVKTPVPEGGWLPLRGDVAYCPLPAGGWDPMAHLTGTHFGAPIGYWVDLRTEEWDAAESEVCPYL